MDTLAFLLLEMSAHYHTRKKTPEILIVTNEENYNRHG